MAGARSDSPGVECPDRGCELPSRGAFEEETAGAGFHRAIDARVEVEGGEHQHRARPPAATSRRVASIPSSSGMRMSMVSMSGSCSRAAGEGMLTVADLADDGQINVGVDRHAQPLALEFLFVGDDDSDHT